MLFFDDPLQQRQHHSSLCCSVRKKRWMMKVANDGHKNCCWLDPKSLGSATHPRAEKKYILKSRQIDHCPKHLHLVVCKAFNGILIIVCNQSEDFLCLKKCIFFSILLKIRFFPSRSFFSVLFFCAIPKKIYEEESLPLKALNLIWTLFNFGVIVAHLPPDVKSHRF